MNKPAAKHCDLPADAVRAILGNADIRDPGAIQIRTCEHRFSTISFLTIHNETFAHRYVLKRPNRSPRQEPWSPRNEFENLQLLLHASCESDLLHVPQAVAFGEDPPFLLTSYIAGTSAEDVVKSGCRRFASPNRRAAAMDVCRRLGEWVCEKLRATTRPAAPYPFHEYRESCGSRLQEISESYGRRGRRVAELVTRWLDQIPATPFYANCFPITTEHAVQYDCAPHNFIVGDDQRIWAIDFESLSYKPLLADPCSFRLWLERMLGNPRYARSAVRRCWSAFALHGIEPVALVILSYAHALLADMAWQRSRHRVATHHEAMHTKMRFRLLEARRFAFLTRLSACTPSHDAAAHLLLSL